MKKLTRDETVHGECYYLASEVDAQPVQEPHEYDWSMLEAAKESLREHMARIKELEAALAQPPLPVQPQREWVGLTDDETMLIANQTSGQNWGNESHIQRLRKTIEAKLKEKNT